jgi:VanZ family protein
LHSRMHRFRSTIEWLRDVCVDRWLPPRKAILHAVAMAPLVAIGVLSVVPGEDRPHVFGASQFEHMAAYIIAAAALALVYAPEFKPVRIVLFLGAYGAALEFCQIWIPGRNAALVDVASDVVGAVIGVAVAMMIARVMPKLRGTHSRGPSQGHNSGVGGATP